MFLCLLPFRALTPLLRWQEWHSPIVLFYINWKNGNQGNNQLISIFVNKMSAKLICMCNCLLRFYQHDAMLAQHLLSSCVLPSVCSSIASWYCTKMAKHKISGEGITVSSTTLVIDKVWWSQLWPSWHQQGWLYESLLMICTSSHSCCAIVKPTVTMHVRNYAGCQTERGNCWKWASGWHRGSVYIICTTVIQDMNGHRASCNSWASCVKFTSIRKAYSKTVQTYLKLEDQTCGSFS